ncbi:hypothetical protein Tco_0103471 [Tanacetum coccineum]
MKNPEDDFTFGDQFLNEKSTEEEPGKANVETKVESMVTVPIHQASLSIPSLSTPIIDISPPKPVVYKLEHHDLYSKIDKQVNEVIKEAVHNALQALLYECFRDLRRHTPKTRKPDLVIPPNDLAETENNWADALVKTYKDPEENKLLQKIGDMVSFIQWCCKQIGKEKLVKADFEGQAYKIARPFHKNISLQFQMEECHLLLTDQIDLMNPKGNRVVHDISKPLPLGGPPGQVTIQAEYFFNKDMEYLVSGNKERRHALSISKLKAAYYPDFRLEELVPSLWTESESAYDMSSTYEIVLRRADYKEYKISKADFKNLHPSDFEDLYLLNLQGKLNHLSGFDKVHLSTAVNLWTRNTLIKQRMEDLQLEDYTIVHKPRAVIYKDKNDQKKMMQETEVHKFSDDTLTRILEKLDYMVKDYELFKFNSGMENRIWTEYDNQRSQEFIKLIEKRRKIRRIFRSLECFISGRLRDIDYRLIKRTK